MKKLELWQQIPENFQFERIVEPIINKCCRDVLKIFSPQDNRAELIQWDRNIIISCGTHGDPFIQSSRSELVLALWQEAEITFFMLLLKAAAQVWELEHVLFPKWDASLSDWMDKRDDSEKDGRRRQEMIMHPFIEDDFSEVGDTSPSYVQLKKVPHWDPVYYDICIDNKNRDIIIYDEWRKEFWPWSNKPIEEKSFRIWFDEIGDYLKTLFVFAQAYGGRTHPGRYKEMLDYLFSDELREDLRMRDRRIDSGSV